MMRIYVGSSLLNIPKVREIQSRLSAIGAEITYDWTQHGKIEDANELLRIAVLETDGVKECDVFFMVHPARTGTHVELGIAIAFNKPIVMLSEPDAGPYEEKTFYRLPNVRRFVALDDAINYVKQLMAFKPGSKNE